MSQKHLRDDSKDPLLPKSYIICIYISREAIHSTKTYVKIDLRNLPPELVRSLQQNNFERMIHFTTNSINISAPFLRTAEHTFGRRCLTSLFRTLIRSFQGIPFNRERLANGSGCEKCLLMDSPPLTALLYTSTSEMSLSLSTEFR